MDDVTEIIVGTAAFVLTIFAIATVGAVAAAAAIPAAIGYGIYWHQVKSPTARERQQKERTWALYRATRRKFTAVDISTFIGDRVGFPTEDDPNIDLQFTIASRLVGMEELDSYPPEPPELCDTIEGGRYRDFLNQVSPDDYEARLAHICRVAQLCAEPPTVENVANVIYTAVATLDDGRPILPKTSKGIDDNFFREKEVPPREYKGDNIIDAYLRGTPLALMAEMIHDDSIDIPHDLRTRHMAVIAGTGGTVT